MQTNGYLLMALIEQAGLPALRIAFALALIIFVFGEIVIFRTHRQFSDRRRERFSRSPTRLKTARQPRNPKKK